MFWVSILIGDFISSFSGWKPYWGSSGWWSRRSPRRSKRRYNIGASQTPMKRSPSVIPSSKNKYISDAQQAMKYGNSSRYKL